MWTGSCFSAQFACSFHAHFAWHSQSCGCVRFTLRIALSHMFPDVFFELRRIHWLKCFSNREHVSYMVVGVCFDCAMWCLFRSVYQVPVNLFSSRSHKQWCLSFAVLLMLLGGMVPFGPRVCLTRARRITTMNKSSLPLTWRDGIQRERVTSRSTATAAKLTRRLQSMRMTIRKSLSH